MSNLDESHNPRHFYNRLHAPCVGYSRGLATDHRAPYRAVSPVHDGFEIAYSARLSPSGIMFGMAYGALMTPPGNRLCADIPYRSCLKSCFEATHTCLRRPLYAETTHRGLRILRQVPCPQAVIFHLRRSVSPCHCLPRRLVPSHCRSYDAAPYRCQGSGPKVFASCFVV